MKMEDELIYLVEVSVLVSAALTYCYFLVTKISNGKTRFFSVLPIFYLFYTLPWYFSSVHLRGISTFSLTWVSNFKLLLFCFDLGPLTLYNNSFIQFVSVAAFPVKIKEHPSSSNPSLRLEPLLNFAANGLLLALLVNFYTYKEFFPHQLILLLYCLHMFLVLDIVLLGEAILVRAVLGLELEVAFNRPYLATSLQDFWGRRWNLVVSNILRQSVYDPTRYTLGWIIGETPANAVALITVFVVSGLMHELVYYYITCGAGPSWEITWFFVLHGVCTAVEIVVKSWVRALGWRLLRPVGSVALVLGFVAVTGFWLVFPPILRSGADVKGIGEYAALAEFLSEKHKGLMNQTRLLFLGGPSRL